MIPRFPSGGFKDQICVDAKPKNATLVEHHGRLLEKDELLKKVWPDTFVEEANLSYNISIIRKALGDGANGQRYIEPVPKHVGNFRGY